MNNLFHVEGKHSNLATCNNCKHHAKQPKKKTKGKRFLLLWVCTSSHPEGLVDEHHPHHGSDLEIDKSIQTPIISR